MARPSDYSLDLALRICELLVEGYSLRAICRQEEMPGQSTVFRWLETHEAFREQYARAREMQAEGLADELTEIADDARNDWMERTLKDGSTEKVVDTEHINRSRLRVDTRKWIASKLLPKKYGDKVETTLQGPNGGPLEVTWLGS